MDLSKKHKVEYRNILKCISRDARDDFKRNVVVFTLAKELNLSIIGKEGMLKENSDLLSEIICKLDHLYILMNELI